MASLILSLLSIVLLADLASAHVTVLPKETAANAYEVFTVRVPTEKDVSTVKLEVKIPQNVNITRLEPKPGWPYELAKDADGKIESISWTAEDKGWSATEFGEFKIQGKVGGESGLLVWKAYQYYEDGSTVEWTGAADSDKPAPAIQVKQSTEIAQGTVEDHAVGDGSKSSSLLPLILSIAALALALGSFAISVRRGRNRPTT